MSVPQISRQRGVPRAFVILVGAAAAFLVIGGMRDLSGIIGPVFLALTLTIAVYPLRARATERGLPGWVGTAVGVLGVYAILIVLTTALVLAVARFATLLPEYQQQFDDLAHNVADTLNGWGIDEAELQKMGHALDPSRIVVGAVESVLAGLAGVTSSLFFIIALILFMGIDASQFPRKFATATQERRAIYDALVDFTRGTRKYLVVSTVFGLVVACIDLAVLALLDVPDPLLWGLLAFITNYIPNIGFIIGLVPPAALALLDSGPGLMLAVIAAYMVINFVIQTIIQPRVVGSAVGISATVSFLSLIFWAYVLGAYGALLAVPLSLLFKAFLVDGDPEARWMSPLISGSEAPPVDQ